MSLEIVFADRDVLERHEPVARLVFSDRVDQLCRVTIRNAAKQ
jgi:hypothetical protein